MRRSAGGPRTVAASGLLAALALVGVACTKQTPAAKPPVPASAIHWERRDLHPVTQPIVAGGRFVVVVAQGTALVLEGLDQATGATVWQQPVTASATTQGVSPEVGLAGDVVVAYAAGRTAVDATMIGIHAVDGSRAWSGPYGTFFDWPHACDARSTDLCVTAGLHGVEALRIDAVEGVVRAKVPLPTGGRLVGDALISSDARDPETLSELTTSGLGWSVPIDQVFRVDGPTTDRGWSFMGSPPAVGLHVGSVGYGPPIDREHAATFDYAQVASAGFRMSDGTVVWRDDGSFLVCGRLACAEDDAGDPTAGVRIRARGTVEVPPDATDLPPPPKDFHVDLEGFDLATGKTTWRFDAGTDADLATVSSPPRPSADEVVLSRAGKPVVLDLRSGRVHAVTGDGVAWCAAATTYDTEPVPGSDASAHHEGEQALHPCDPRSGADRPAPAVIPRFVGATTAGVTAWSQADAVEAGPATA